MDSICYELYIDESGEFIDDDPSNAWKNPSLVGGYLCKKGMITPSLLDQWFPETAHACKKFEPRFISILEQLKSLGGEFVLFENRERIRVIDGDTTYLNIISEGLARLFRDLTNRHAGSEVKINVQIATRENVEKNAQKQTHFKIEKEEYVRRLEEKLVIAIGRNTIHNATWSLNFAVATKSKWLMIADVICNTWLTRTAKGKFQGITTNEHILEIFQDSTVSYSVFENATIGYLKKLLLENRISELMYQVCTLMDRESISEIVDILIHRIIDATKDERKTYFSYMSLQIGTYIKRGRSYLSDTIHFANNYIEYLLNPLSNELSYETKYWLFDTYFYLTTAYDHLGDLNQIKKCLGYCIENIDAIDKSWENLLYYYNFRIREANLLLNLYDFDGMLDRTESIIELLGETKRLFTSIAKFDKTITEIRSDSLAKIYGQQVLACLNSVRERPVLLDKGLSASKLSITEFGDDEGAVKRQYEYKCTLLCEAGKAQEAYETLKMAYSLSDSMVPEEVSDKILGYIWEKGNKASYDLMHYTNVMLALLGANDDAGKVMWERLHVASGFGKLIKMEGYPYNHVLMNIGRCYLLHNDVQQYARYMDAAYNISISNPDESTVVTFGISIAADIILNERNGKLKIKGNGIAKYNIAREMLLSKDVPQTIIDRFLLTRSIDELSDEQITQLSNRFLKS